MEPVSLLTFVALTLATTPLEPTLDPGPHPDCPNDMRMVEGLHHDQVQHYCVDPRKQGKQTNCYAYHEGITGLEGELTQLRVCMDRYEAPNVRGAKPYVMKSYVSAKRWCEQRGKRMCTEQEWELGCEGPSHLPLAYGWAVDVKACNSDKGWRPVDFEKFAEGGEVADEESKRLWQGAPSGSRPRCVSPFGLVDMMGNVEEWVTSRSRRKFPGSLMGGFWAKSWTGCRGTNDAHEPTFQFYETGFRCCAEPGSLDAEGRRVEQKATPAEGG